MPDYAIAKRHIYNMRLVMDGEPIVEIQETTGDIKWSDPDYQDLIGGVKIAAGPCDVFTSLTPHVASVDVNSRFRQGTQWSDCAIIFSGPNNDNHTTEPLGAYLNDTLDGSGGVLNARWERIMFYGHLGQRQGPAGRGRGPRALEFAGSDSGILTRRNFLAQSLNTSPRQVIDDLATDMSIGNDGYLGFPGATFANLDVPFQGQDSTGQYLERVMAPFGVSPTCQWDFNTDPGPDTNWWPGGNYPPNYIWRPSRWLDGPNTARRQTHDVWRPWTFNYESVGMTISDFVAAVHVAGSASFTGSASLTNLDDRQKIGNRSAKVSGWSDSDAECDACAELLLGSLGAPFEYDRIKALTFNLEDYYRDNLTAAVDVDEALWHAWEMGQLQVGDRIKFHHDGDTEFRDPSWPADCMADEDELIAVCHPWVFDDSAGLPETVKTHRILGFVKTWTPTKGWTITYSLMPDIYNYDVCP